MGALFLQLLAAARRCRPQSDRTAFRIRHGAGWRCSRLIFGLTITAVSAHGQTNATASTSLGPLSISLGPTNGAADVDSGIKILFLITLLSLAPSILLLMTCFTRVVIVLGFVRSALQLQGAPANQIIIGLSLVHHLFCHGAGLGQHQPRRPGTLPSAPITGPQALDAASGDIRDFMLKQTRPKDVELFVSMAKLPPTRVEDLPLRVVTPAFIISELRTAFQMGFLIYVPFILIDIVVATVLMSMGMMMMPPMTISLPLKLLLFVLVDGWSLIVQSLVRSFGM